MPILTKYNYESWAQNIEDICLMKNRTEENVKIAFLRQGLSEAHRSDLRIAMKAEEKKEKSARTKYNGQDVTVAPYTWALHYIQRVILQGGSTKEELAEKCKKTEMQLQTLDIAKFGYNLNKYHAKFNALVEEIGTLGQAIEPHILAMYYQNGVRPHRDLKYLTIDKARRQGKTYLVLHQDYVEALDDQQGRNGPRTRDSRNNRNLDGKANAGKFKGKCSHCGKEGHKEDKCWTKHPDQFPDWVKKTDNNKSD